MKNKPLAVKFSYGKNTASVPDEDEHNFTSSCWGESLLRFKQRCLYLLSSTLRGLAKTPQKETKRMNRKKIFLIELANVLWKAHSCPDRHIVNFYRLDQLYNSWSCWPVPKNPKTTGGDKIMPCKSSHSRTGVDSLHRTVLEWLQTGSNLMLETCLSPTRVSLKWSATRDLGCSWPFTSFKAWNARMQFKSLLWIYSRIATASSRNYRTLKPFLINVPCDSSILLLNSMDKMFKKIKLHLKRSSFYSFPTQTKNVDTLAEAAFVQRNEFEYGMFLLEPFLNMISDSYRKEETQ